MLGRKEDPIAKRICEVCRRYDHGHVCFPVHLMERGIRAVVDGYICENCLEANAELAKTVPERPISTFVSKVGFHRINVSTHFLPEPVPAVCWPHWLQIRRAGEVGPNVWVSCFPDSHDAYVIVTRAHTLELWETSFSSITESNLRELSRQRFRWSTWQLLHKITPTAYHADLVHLMNRLPAYAVMNAL